MLLGPAVDCIRDDRAGKCAHRNADAPGNIRQEGCPSKLLAETIDIDIDDDGDTVFHSHIGVIEAVRYHSH